MTSTQHNSSRAQEIDVPYILNYRCCIHTVLIRYSFNLFISTHAVHSRNAFAIGVDGWTSYSLVCMYRWTRMSYIRVLSNAFHIDRTWLIAFEVVNKSPPTISCELSPCAIRVHGKIRYNELSFLHSYIQLYRIEKKNEQYEFLWHMHRSASSKKEKSFGIPYAYMQKLRSNFGIIIFWTKTF